MAHVRRKMYDLHQAHRWSTAAEALERIGALYGIENEIRGLGPSDRQAVRSSRARPLLDSLQTWFKSMLSTLSRKSDVAIAIHYAVDRWPALVRYCDDGNLEIDNNAPERALRAVAIGRNYAQPGIMRSC